MQKKRVLKKKIAKKPVVKKVKEQPIGKVAHYYDKIGVIALKLTNPVAVGNTIRIEGGEKSFTQKIASMQIDHEKIKKAKKGDEVGIKITQKAREGYRVFRQK
ncbi:MAG: hypothetical protein HYW95_02700 [Candidatus Wildermuthbacteria bacterium]|nr:hypothetical protein [Candidatus Wildermuthbacteria bacterium]